ncbi:hypothetical protein MHYP_G00245310 [Metynnis hypsauchen]
MKCVQLVICTRYSCILAAAVKLHEFSWIEAQVRFLQHTATHHGTCPDRQFSHFWSCWPIRIPIQCNQTVHLPH